MNCSQLETKINNLENEWRNQKNTLITAKAEAESWKKQLEKEREKIVKMKEEKRTMLDEVVEQT